MESDLHSLFGLHVHSCTHWLRLRNHARPPPPFWAHIRERYRSAKIDPLEFPMYRCAQKNLRVTKVLASGNISRNAPLCN
jgi:hypothetical protein